MKNENTEYSTFDKYLQKNIRHQYLLQLQKKFENNIINENDISEKDRKDLESLYLEQISNLERKIKNVENKIK